MVLVSLYLSDQILLILRVNLQWGIGDLWFAMGDEVIGDFIMAIHILPLINMLLMLCPEGAEGTSFAMVRATSARPIPSTHSQATTLSDSHHFVVVVVADHDTR